MRKRMTNSGVVTGATPWEAAVRVAGALAELGVSHVRIEHPDGSVQTPLPRVTDLPRMISDSTGSVLVADDVGVIVRIGSMMMSWSTSDSARADRWRDALLNPINPAATE
jgi:hypothetical protein